MTGVSGGWVWFNMNDNTSGAVANMPSDAKFFELYEWEYDAAGAVSGLWFGKLANLETSGATEERTIFHFVVE
jgi:hypothetical protein